MGVFNILITIVLLAIRINADDVISVNPGPVTAAMENLAYNTAAITDEISMQLNTKIDRTSDLLLGNIEVIIASAMDQLSQPIYEASKKVNSEKCQQLWTMDELRNRIDFQLSNCTQDIHDIMEAFRIDTDTIANTLQSNVNAIVNLPVACQLLSQSLAGGEILPSFASSSSCFIEKMADINRVVSGELNRVSKTLVRTRQLSKTSVANAQQCANDVVAEVVDYLNKALENC